MRCAVRNSGLCYERYGNSRFGQYGSANLHVRTASEGKESSVDVPIVAAVCIDSRDTANEYRFVISQRMVEQKMNNGKFDNNSMLMLILGALFGALSGVMTILSSVPGQAETKPLYVKSSLEFDENTTQDVLIRWQKPEAAELDEWTEVKVDSN